VYVEFVKEAFRLEEIYKRFPTRQECLRFIEGIRWSHDPVCPHCGSDRITPMSRESRYHCNGCNLSFSVTVKTLFHNTRIPLQKWFAAIALYVEEGQFCPVRQLAEMLEINKDSAWAMIGRIKEASREYSDLLSGVVKSWDNMKTESP